MEIGYDLLDKAPHNVFADQCDVEEHKVGGQAETQELRENAEAMTAYVIKVKNCGPN
jgi:hypothetical protein